jgi:hypothetical protein
MSAGQDGESSEGGKKSGTTCEHFSIHLFEFLTWSVFHVSESALVDDTPHTQAPLETDQSPGFVS